jgi:transcriptional regulator with XRE-family HTH domain
MTQQQFADRLGKSKSWVDKVERGVRRLERVSNLREVADTLRIDVEVLLAARPVRPTRCLTNACYPRWPAVSRRSIRAYSAAISGVARTSSRSAETWKSTSSMERMASS